MGSSRIEQKEIDMNPGTLWRILIAVVIVAGAVVLGTAAYQAGIAQGLAQNGTAVAPGAVGYYGWHPFGFGFGLFGFLGTLLFFFLIFALIRALLFRGGPRGSGWYGPGGGWRGGHWESRGRETFDDWHRQAHEHGDDRPGTSPPTSA
jgi:hypothetical protein